MDRICGGFGVHTSKVPNPSWQNHTSIERTPVLRVCVATPRIPIRQIHAARVLQRNIRVHDDSTTHRFWLSTGANAQITHEVWNVVYGHFGGCEEYQQVRRNSDLSTKLDECLTGIDVTQSKSFAPESNLKLSIISASFSG